MSETAPILKNLQHLLKLLKVSVTQKSLRDTFGKHPDYPSMEAVSDTFRRFNLETLSIRIGEEHLSEIPYPALCHSYKEGGRFVILEKIENETLTYFDAEWGRKQIAVAGFTSELQWSGALMLIHPNAASGEPDYKKKQKEETLRQTANYLIYALAGLLLLLPVLKLSVTYLPVYVLLLVGGFFSFVLLQRQFGAGTALTQAFCKTGGKSDCDAVIHSPASKLFGMLHLSEIGMWYFTGGILLLLTASLTMLPVFNTLLVITLPALPFSLFSVYYQGMVLKKWCPLCLAVMGILWLQLATLLPFSGMPSVSWEHASLVLVSFTLPLFIGAAVRRRVMDSYKIPSLEKKLNRFLWSERVFQALLNDQPPVDMGTLQREFAFGAEKAQLTLTIISNPLCNPCKLAHALADNLLLKYADRLSVTYRFLVNPNTPQAEDTRVMRHLAALRLVGTTEILARALSDWYKSAGARNTDAWKARNPLPGEADETEIEALINEQLSWCQRSGIAVTPTLFINDKKLPEEYSLYDLNFQIGKLLEST